MIVLIVSLFVAGLAWRLAVVYFAYLAALLGLIIELTKLAWRLLARAYGWFRRCRGGSPPQTPAKPVDSGPCGNPIGSADDVRPLKNDRPVNSRISDNYRK
jgi:hypothetical protein